MKNPSRHPAAKRDSAGFTLIELMVVVVIIGILAAIAIPNYLRAQENAKTGECRSNQKNLTTAAAVYAIDNFLGDVVINSADLIADGYAIAPLGECPKSGNGDNADYDITLDNGIPRDVTCLTMGGVHEWKPN